MFEFLTLEARFVQREIYQGVWFSYWRLIWSEFKVYEEGGYHKIKSGIVPRGPDGEFHWDSLMLDWSLNNVFDKIIVAEE